MNIAIVGATGLVGREIINLCEEFLSKDASYTLFASSNSAGKNLKVNGNEPRQLHKLSKDHLLQVSLDYLRHKLILPSYLF